MARCKQLCISIFKQLSIIYIQLVFVQKGHKMFYKISFIATYDQIECLVHTCIVCIELSDIIVN